MHEFSEIMGRIPLMGVNLFGQADYMLFDLFHYTGAGVRGLNNGPGRSFSIDNGTTLLKAFNDAAANSGSDLQDWASGSNDTFNAFSNSSVENDLTPVDLRVMDAIGYDFASGSPTPTPSPTPPATPTPTATPTATPTPTVTPSPTPTPTPSGTNLAPYQPPGWSDKIVASNVTGTTTDTALRSTDTIYVDWAEINNGSVATTKSFYTALYVDGSLRTYWTTAAPFNPNSYAYVSDYSIGSLSTGTHTIKIVVDAANAISETDESDDAYTKTITVN